MPAIRSMIARVPICFAGSASSAIRNPSRLLSGLSRHVVEQQLHLVQIVLEHGIVVRLSGLVAHAAISPFGHIARHFPNGQAINSRLSARPAHV